MPEVAPPLVTFVVTTYQQEQFIEEALQSGLDQTYQPLEILVLDDASADRTAELAQKMIDRYRGPHAVRLIRNRENKGLHYQVNHFMREVRGGLIVANAGDDVSLPHRVE